MDHKRGSSPAHTTCSFTMRNGKEEKMCPSLIQLQTSSKAESSCTQSSSWHRNEGNWRLDTANERLFSCPFPRQPSTSTAAFMARQSIHAGSISYKKRINSFQRQLRLQHGRLKNIVGETIKGSQSLSHYIVG